MLDVLVKWSCDNWYFHFYFTNFLAFFSIVTDWIVSFHDYYMIEQKENKPKTQVFLQRIHNFTTCSACCIIKLWGFCLCHYIVLMIKRRACLYVNEPVNHLLIQAGLMKVSPLWVVHRDHNIVLVKHRSIRLSWNIFT